MSALMQTLGYVISFACLLFAAHLFAVRPVTRAPSLLLGAAFAVFAIQSALLSMLLAQGTPHPAAIVRPALAMTIGPLLLLYFTSAADPSFRLRPRHALHFAPALFIAFELSANVYVIDIDLAIIASFAAYAILAWRKVLRGADQFAHLGAGAANAYRWLIAVAVLLLASAIGEIAIDIDIAQGGVLSESIPLLIVLIVDLVVVAVALVAALMRPSPFDWLYEFGAAAAAAVGPQTALSEAERAACIADFERLVGAERFYAAENATLRVAARRLGAPARRLSEAINRTYGESYSRRMNRLRVEEAKRLLRDHPEKSVIEVMFDAGFRTKSVFNKEFRAIEGVSPTEYRAAAER